MNLLLYLALLVTIAYLGGIYLFGRKGWISFYTGGVEFLLIGAVLGSGFITPMIGELNRELFPFIHIELAWIGLLYGIQLEFRQLRRHPVVDWGLMAGESLVTMTCVFLTAFFFLVDAFTYSSQDILRICLLLAVTASLSNPWALGVLNNIFRFRSTLLRRLRFVVGIDDLPGLAVFTALFFYPSGGVPTKFRSLRPVHLVRLPAPGGCSAGACYDGGSRVSFI